MRYNTRATRFTQTVAEETDERFMMLADSRDDERNRRGSTRMNKQRDKMRRDRRDREWDEE